jgi:hypothetical protein
VKSETETTYSANVPGAAGNYHWSARFDRTDGFLGITQERDDGPHERVLLSPAQVRALLRFIRPLPAKRRKARGKK